MRQLAIEVYNFLSMNANSSQNTVEDESLSQSYDLWEAKFSPSSLARQSRSRISKRSRFTRNSKLLKSYLFKSIIQKNSKQVLQQSQQMDLQLELLQSAIDNLRRENYNQKYKMGQFFLNHSLQGQLAFSQLREQ